MPVTGSQGESLSDKKMKSNPVGCLLEDVSNYLQHILPFQLTVVRTRLLLKPWWLGKRAAILDRSVVPYLGWYRRPAAVTDSVRTPSQLALKKEKRGAHERSHLLSHRAMGH